MRRLFTAARSGSSRTVSRLVEMALVRGEDAAGVPLVVDQHPVGALGPDAADEPFGVAVRRRRARRGPDHLDADGGEQRVEGTSELHVPVADEKPEAVDPVVEVQNEIAGLLSGPRNRCWPLVNSTGQIGSNDPQEVGGLFALKVVIASPAASSAMAPTEATADNGLADLPAGTTVLAEQPIVRT